MNKRVAAVVAAVAALAVMAIVTLVQQGPSSEGVRLMRQADGSMVLADRGGRAPVLELYEDYECPVCKELHARVDATIERLAREGKVKVVYHPVTIFQQEPSRSNSIRAAAAARCVPESSWLAFRDELYAMQPEPHGVTGFAVEDLVAAVKKAGAPSAESCVTSQAYAEAHLRDTAGITIEGTPTVVLDGRVLGNEAFDPVALERAITGGDGVTV